MKKDFTEMGKSPFSYSTVSGSMGCKNRTKWKYQ